jgi:hypothetical protein
MYALFVERLDLWNGVLWDVDPIRPSSSETAGMFLPTALACGFLCHALCLPVHRHQHRHIRIGIKISVAITCQSRMMRRHQGIAVSDSCPFVALKGAEEPWALVNHKQSRIEACSLSLPRRSRSSRLSPLPLCSLRFRRSRKSHNSKQWYNGVAVDTEHRVYVCACMQACMGGDHHSSAWHACMRAQRRGHECRFSHVPWHGMHTMRSVPWHACMHACAHSLMRGTGMESDASIYLFIYLFPLFCFYFLIITPIN